MKKSVAPQSIAEKTAVVVWGTGSIGSRHLEVLESLEGVQPIAIPVRSSRLSELQNQGVLALSHLSEAQGKNATNVIIATDTRRHLADTVTALSLQMNVLVEKPLTPTHSEALQLWKETKASSNKIFVGCCLRFSESLQTFKQWLPKAGQLHSVRIECQSYLPEWRPQRDYRQSYSARQGEGGVLLDLIHEIDYATWLFGWPIAIRADLQNTGQLQIESEEAADLFWKTEADVPVSIRLDYLTRKPRRQLLVQGKNGELLWDGVSNTVLWTPQGADPQLFESKQTRNQMLRAQTLAFLQASEGDHASPLATLKDGIRALAICDAARQASQQQKQVQVEYRGC